MSSCVVTVLYSVRVNRVIDLCVVTVLLVFLCVSDSVMYSVSHRAVL